MVCSFGFELPSRHRLVEWARGRAEWFRSAADDTLLAVAVRCGYRMVSVTAVSERTL